MSDLTYPETGATRSGALPAGYHHLRHRAAIGHGRADLETAGAAITGFRMHRESGAGIEASTARAEEGTAVRVSVGVGPLRLSAPCRVIWTVYGPERIGFGYGTLPGHPECGEECFVAELADDGTVSFAVTAFSRPARWYARLGGPLVPVLQRWYARRLGRTLRRIVARERRLREAPGR
ncbi:DUF1990 domain-containing protein [Streptomyces sp. OfavH-34-F]|uniref:DUF1990 family protein n=1 Tax=Streptomyces sp. OfavH-34-F TaxID=2917760 RepID=UPI001EF2F6DA|nr:DUF1990 domain-containing protein [Streptomyces sp. OfavH-34-F]MCG7528443.1 DUF1990 domain-containing protein [Streptomyces sp. OfavH-34-F]